MDPTLQHPWPFEGPENETCYVSVHVLNGAPIRYVCHDWDDGAWQFLPDLVTAPQDCRLVCLKHIFGLDPSIGEVADLPDGWRAERGADGVWHRSVNHPYPTFSAHGYQLVPVALFPDDFPGVPQEEERSYLQAGRTVKLVFWFAPEKSTGERPEYTVERMWVNIVSRDGETGNYTGTLDNDPAFHTGLVWGDQLVFHPLHVLAVMD